MAVVLTRSLASDSVIPQLTKQSPRPRSGTAPATAKLSIMKLSYVLAFATLVAITIATPTNAVSTMQKMRPVRNLRVAGKGEEATGNKPGNEPGNDPGEREGPDPETGNKN